MQQQVDDVERDAIFQKLKQIPENNKCFDCDKKHPKWSSVYLGLYLCLDCAGKHREYGPQISFARSLDLDTWNRRYITFMEQGGNIKASEFFKKQGLKAPYDYKNAQIQKYKQELTKKVDAVLQSGKPQAEITQTTQATVQPLDEVKIINKHNAVKPHFLTNKSASDNPKHGENANDDPFAKNIILNKAETKTKGFTVEFNNKNKSGFGSNKGRLAAKKIDNVDIDALTLNEDAGSNTKSKFTMAEPSLSIKTQNIVREVHSKNNSPYLNEQSAEEKFKKFQGAKAISSDAFKTDSPSFDPSNAKKFSNAKAISSSQYFGEREEEDDDEDQLYQAAENFRDLISHYGGKLKETANEFAARVKEDWEY